MSDEPLYCPFCGAEDFGCGCDYREGEGTHGPPAWCEVCGVRLPCPYCPPMAARVGAGAPPEAT